MERLQKVLARAGVASRRKAENLIATGHVKVNGQVITEMGVQVSNKDVIEVDNVPLSSEQPVYFMLYKPRGVISSASDDKGRKVVTDFFSEVPERVYPVGRLDYDAAGLLILTNDGDFAHKLMHPKYEIEKVYAAKVKGIPDKQSIYKLRKGIMVEGRKTAPAKVRVLSSDQKKNSAIVELIIHEGRNHQVKKMLEAVGYPVQKLKRESYGDLQLGDLHPGEYRVLKKYEVQRLLQLASITKKK